MDKYGSSVIIGCVEKLLALAMGECQSLIGSISNRTDNKIRFVIERNKEC